MWRVGYLTRVCHDDQCSKHYCTLCILGLATTHLTHCTSRGPGSHNMCHCLASQLSPTLPELLEQKKVGNSGTHEGRLRVRNERI